GTLCPAIYSPVCGCDGNTYDNSCIAQYLYGVTNWTDGACSSSGCMDMSGLDFGLCDMFLGYAWTGSGCTPVSGCSYTIGNIDYTPNFYASAVDCQSQCGDFLIDCVNAQQQEWGWLVDCFDQGPSVCGCNGVTYAGECSAFYYGGVTSFTLGECGGAGCRRIPTSVMFGECAMALGFASTATGCIAMSGCSYIGNNGYDYSDFFYNSIEECQSACGMGGCIDTALIDPNWVCIQIYDPVCGCDQVTYPNACVATYQFGITSYTPGECTTSVGSLMEESIRIFPNPTTNFINITNTENFDYRWRIFGSTGKQLLDGKSTGLLTTINVESLAAGAYIIQIQKNHDRFQSYLWTKE
ncbi:MAG: Kazal-type serine protease inhibitor domain-containing protein, partial [Flavobacteriales bacterium]